MSDRNPTLGARRDAYAVVIGIGRYRDPKIRQLNYACADARALRDILVDPNLGAFPPENVKLLLDDGADLRSIKGAIGKWLFQQAGQQSTVVIFFAGHGGLEPDKEGREKDGMAKYLLPWDSEPDDLFSTGLPDTEFRRLLSAVRAEAAVVFLDACYAAGVTPRGVRNIGIVENVYARLSQGKGRIVIASAQPNEQSWEDDGFGHGIFTYHLLEALRGEGGRDDDGCVSAFEVFHHLQRRVPESARRLCNSIQQPLLCGEETGSIILTLAPPGQARPSPPTEAPVARMLDNPRATPMPPARSASPGPGAGSRFCVGCGSAIDPRNAFCIRCGRRLK